MKRQVIQTVTGAQSIDGAGVHLVRVLGPNEVKLYDPFLMLDAFDSKNPADYIKGFPFHPHRGIETVTYLMKGEIDHEDSLGNKGTIRNGESQWMTAGSGILHQEMPQPSEHLLGLQLWVNLPQADKMTVPKYFDITNEMVKEVEEPFGNVRVISGEYNGHTGVKGHHVDMRMLDIKIKPGESFSLNTDPEKTLFVYIVEGEGYFGDDKEKAYPSKMAALFSKDEVFYAEAGKDGIHFVLFEALPLNEPIVWGGPIVMNTRDELDMAFFELRSGSFIKHKIHN